MRQSKRKIREVLRLHHECNLSKRQIAPIVGIGTTTVFDYLARAGQVGLSWPLPKGIGDEELERLLFPSSARQSPEQRAQPDWPSIHREGRRKGITLRLLWEKYRATAPQGYGYSQFCEFYRLLRQQVEVRIGDSLNLLITGPAGVGKTWVACALAHRACTDNLAVLYARTQRLLEDLALALADGRYPG